MTIRIVKSRLKDRKKRKNSSHIWLLRQVNDHYVNLAKKEGYRSRAAYKLIEMQEKFRFIKNGMCVIDLGAAPGSWSQVVSKYIGDGKLISLDILPMLPLDKALIVHGDFMDQTVQKNISSNSIDIILSDISPNLSGISSVDQSRIVAICESVFDFAKKRLSIGGTMVFKIFQGGTEVALLNEIKMHFTFVKHVKPKASRKESREMYLFASGFTKKKDVGEGTK